MPRPTSTRTSRPPRTRCTPATHVTNENFTSRIRLRIRQVPRGKDGGSWAGQREGRRWTERSAARRLLAALLAVPLVASGCAGNGSGEEQPPSGTTPAERALPALRTTQVAG